MHLLRISASNIQHAQNNSTSFKVCKLIQQITFDNYGNKVETDIIPLVQYELRPCHGCGSCFQNGKCSSDTVFNELYKLPVGIIGHGGGTDDVVELYKGQVFDTISNALSWPVEMTIIKNKETLSNGVIFPVKEVRRNSGSIFPIHEYDWEDIKRRIEPLIHQVIKRVGIK